MPKFTVFKNDDIEKYTDNLSKAVLNEIASLIASGRAKDGKTPSNRYAVINLDEPYAPEVLEIMKRHGHWED